MSIFEEAGEQAIGSAEFYAHLDRLPMPIWQQDADGAVRFANKAWHEELGMPRDSSSYTAAAWREIVHPDDFPLVLETMQSAVAAREAYEVEWRGKPAGAAEDAYKRYVSRAIPTYENGDFEGWIGTSMDVAEAPPVKSSFDTARPRAIASLDDAWAEPVTARAAETQSREYAGMIERLLDASEDCIKVLDLEGHVMFMNANGQVALNIPDFFAVKGAEWLTFWNLRDRKNADAALRAARAGERGQFTGMYAVDGVRHWWSVTVTPIPDADGVPQRLLAVSRKVTDTVLARRRLEAEYRRQRRIALAFQRSALPPLPRIEGIELTAAYRPGQSELTVGGDWYDAFTLDDGRIALTLGDVMGHGLDAAVMMSKIRLVLRTAGMLGAPPAVMLQAAERILDTTRDRYATALAAVYDPAARTLEVASAGHPGPLVANPGGEVESVELEGAMLGLRAGAVRESVTRRIPPGAIVALYTDGLVEVQRDFNAGLAQLRRAILHASANAGALSAEDLVESAIGAQTPMDDLAVLLMRHG